MGKKSKQKRKQGVQTGNSVNVSSSSVSSGNPTRGASPLATANSNNMSGDSVHTGYDSELQASDQKQSSTFYDSNGGDDKKTTNAVESRMIHTALMEEDNPFMEKYASEVSLDKDNVSDRSRLGDAEKDHDRMKSTNSDSNARNVNDVDDDDDEGLMSAPMIAKVHNRNVVESERFTKKRNSLVERTNVSDKRHARILEAGKVSELQGRSYITYTIQYNNFTVRRRYNDFENLRDLLVKLFPTILIPPIPEKQSIRNYGKAITGATGSQYFLPSDHTGSVDLTTSVINGTKKNQDETLIRHRIRVLTQFLNKVLNNDEIMKTPIIVDFLDSNNRVWSEFVASSATFTSLPKNVLQCNPLDPTSSTRVHASLPIPTTTHIHLPKEKVTNSKDPETLDEKLMKFNYSFQKLDQEYKKYEDIMANGLTKLNKKLTKSLSGLIVEYKEISEESAEFTKEAGKEFELASQLALLSRTYDESAITFEQLVSRLHYNVNEPLGESALVATSVRELIKYRRMKLIQLETLRKTLRSKNDQLRKLEQEKNDFSAVDNVINQETAKSGQITFDRPPTAPKGYGGKLLNKFSKIATIVKDTVNYQEVDPQTLKLSLENDIAKLQEMLSVAENDLLVISAEIKERELPKFSKEREEELTDIMRHYSRYMKIHAEKNLEIWKKLKSDQSEAESNVKQVDNNT
ncbi:Atg20p KNAG_0A05530 [Huiozyma naganishii CBS 8797]|uniref:Autophagy-related protein 20 n=1 Tax=Huiozyma naganishii (strain ATCC MYA-139 / BCRC 22969 / CBS 8797 / KCTC 17520 / NBRC 10181 / NCYC 3082 / Yp74L-3) TaxID=1071383 RepID=J7RF79_HUIN7|nr:hypothetical protein KNAG_0A05530 [Kazachstania naganishii CBS 8797]CCK68218.1 hypothetical protein KNAG_0A05530 [Kazachstania naganishii CBS 8797]